MLDARGHLGGTERPTLQETFLARTSHTESFLITVDYDHNEDVERSNPTDAWSGISAFAAIVPEALAEEEFHSSA